MSARPQRARGYVVLLTFFVVCSVAVASGRLASADAGAQLNVSRLLVATGSPGADRPLDGHLWFRGAGGRYYEVHDVGNVLLMIPAAAVAAAAGESDPYADPSVRVRALASMTYAVFCGVGLMALFLVLRRFHSPRSAMLLTLLFVVSTIFLAYAKTALDVLGACLATCVALAALFSLLERRRNWVWLAIGLGAAVGAAGLFRVSWGPFLALGVLLALKPWTRPQRARQAAVVAASAAVATVPTLVYNYVREENVLKPGTDRPGWEQNTLTRDLFDGLFEITISPNKGLLVFCPIFILLFVVLFRRVAARGTLEGGFPWLLLVGVVGYFVFIAKLNNADDLSWGPRYLLPALPILFVAMAGQLQRLLGERNKLAIALVSVSVLLGLAPALTAWNDDLVEFGGVLGAPSSEPIAQEAVFRSIAVQATGRDRAENGFGNDTAGTRSEEQAFPDFWWANFATSHRWAIPLLTIAAVVGLVVAAAAFRRIAPLRAAQS